MDLTHLGRWIAAHATATDDVLLVNLDVAGAVQSVTSAD